MGCLKRLEVGVAEVQRMYVPPIYRGTGIGRAIINQLINDARSIGYRRLRLESLEFLDAAHALYRSVGFRNTDPYADNSMKSYQSTEQLDQYYSSRCSWRWICRTASGLPNRLLLYRKSILSIGSQFGWEDNENRKVVGAF